MAGACMGSYGSYKYLRRPPCSDLGSQVNNNQETVWVIKRYVPTDLRVNAPVPRHKLMSADVQRLSAPSSEWIPAAEPSPYTYMYSRHHEESHVYRSLPSTRCEEYSTLRQMMPSRERPRTHRPANWGTSQSLPHCTFSTQKRFPHINSPMTRYVDELHLTNRLFKLH